MGVGALQASQMISLDQAVQALTGTVMRQNDIEAEAAANLLSQIAPKAAELMTQGADPTVVQGQLTRSYPRLGDFPGISASLA